MRHASNQTVDAYISGVLDGSVPINELARLMIERHLADLERWPATSRRQAVQRGDPFWFEADAAQDVLDFYPLCVHVVGELAGEPFEPLPYQATVDWISFGWMSVETDGRRFLERWIEEGKGNGKSFWMACNGLYMIAGDDEPGATAYALATKEGQAVEAIWGTAAEVAKQSPDLQEDLEVTESVNNRRIWVPGTNCKFIPLPSDFTKADGLIPHALYLDELHEWKRRQLYGKLYTALGKRRQPMLTCTTTAGDDKAETTYEELHEYAIRVLRGWQDGSFVDDRFFAVIYCIDSKVDGCAVDDDPLEERSWYKANPALGHRGTSVRIGQLRSLATRSEVSPEALTDLLRLHCGRRTGSKEKAISELVWASCTATADDGPIGAALAARDWSPFDGRPGYAGLDMSSTRDLTAVSVYLPPTEAFPFEVYRFWAWLPKENLQEACHRDRAPYDRWAREGWLELTDGDEIDHAVIFERLKQINDLYLIVEWAYDPWHATQLKNDFFSETGIEMVKFVQDLPSFGEPTRLFLDSIVGHKLRHDGNPLVRWCAGNVVTKEDAHGNKRPHKKLSNYRIDPIVAAIMARGRAIVTPVPQEPAEQPWDGTVEVW